MFPFVSNRALSSCQLLWISLSLSSAVCVCVCTITVHRVDAISSTPHRLGFRCCFNIGIYTRSGRRRFSLTLDYYYLGSLLYIDPPPLLCVCVCLLLVCYLGVCVLSLCGFSSQPPERPSERLYVLDNVGNCFFVFLVVALLCAKSSFTPFPERRPATNRSRRSTENEKKSH